MDAASFGALFDTFTSQVFRLEGLQSYAVPAEDDSLRAFREGTARPERSVRTSPWLARIAESTAARKVWQRVHLIRHPLSEYLRHELLSYVESQAVGEQIGLVDLAEHPELEDPGPDFWLFDWDTDAPFAVVMHYNDEGAIVGREHTTDGQRLDRMASIRRAAWGAAVPLNVYLAGVHVV